MEDLFRNLNPWSPFWRIKLLWSLPMPQSMSLSLSSKSIRFQPRPELVCYLLLISQSPQDQLDWIHLKLTFSTPWMSPQRLIKVKFKLPKSSRCAQRGKRLRLLKLLFLKSWTLSHSNMVLESLTFMMKELFWETKSSILTHPRF